MLNAKTKKTNFIKVKDLLIPSSVQNGSVWFSNITKYEYKEFKFKDHPYIKAHDLVLFTDFDMMKKQNGLY